MEQKQIPVRFQLLATEYVRLSDLMEEDQETNQGDFVRKMLLRYETCLSLQHPGTVPHLMLHVQDDPEVLAKRQRESEVTEQKQGCVSVDVMLSVKAIHELEVMCRVASARSDSRLLMMAINHYAQARGFSFRRTGLWIKRAAKSW